MGDILICNVCMYFCDMKEVTLSPQGENSPFCKIVTLLKLLFCEIEILKKFTKFSFIDFVLTDRRSLSGKRPKSASGKFFSFRFSLSAERNANTKATEYANLGFSFSILVFFPF